MKPSVLFRLVKDAYQEWSDARASTMGAALAYYTIFAIAPLLVLVLAVAGAFLGEKAATGQLAVELEQTLGAPVAESMQELLANANRPATGTFSTLVAVFVLLFGASGVFAELQGSLNAIWKVQARPDRGWWDMVKDRFLSVSMVLATCFVLLASLVLSAILQALSRYWTPASLPGGAHLWEGINLVISLGVITLLFALIYKVLPDAQIGWHDVWTGAALTAGLFTLGKFLLGLYLAYSGVTSGFGAAGSLVLLLVWVYYSAQIFLFGAAFTHVHAHERGGVMVPAENAIPLEQGNRVTAGRGERSAGLGV